MILDAGVFILAERNPRRAAALLERLAGRTLRTSEAVMAQVWRDPARQVQLTRFLAEWKVTVEPLKDGRAIGVLLARAGTADVGDAAAALMAISGSEVVLTSDPDDLAALGATVVSL